MFESFIEPLDDASFAEGPAPRTPRPVVAVIGGGASGALVALHLARSPGAPAVRLFERRPDVGRGVAYGAARPDHLLNARAGAMSAFQDRPGHFADWLAQVGAPYGRDAFTPRAIYGDYLGDLVRQAMDGGADLVIDHDEVVCARPAARGWSLAAASGRRLTADAVILATGHAPPDPPPGLAPGLAASPLYVADPWSRQMRLAGLGDRVLLVGAGLTMVDAALCLAHGGRRITALSRRGLTPRPHADAPLAPTAAPAAEGSPLALLRALRRASHGQDWRPVVDALRPGLQGVWAAWTPSQRASFLRHARCWWEVVRHRAAPSAARRIAELQAGGRLVVRAARLVSLDLAPDGVEAVWIPRGGSEPVRARFDAVVNCMGRSPDVQRHPDRLLRQLLADGLVRPCPSGLGLEVDAASSPLGRSGAPTPGLYAVGPLTQGRFWEITAIPEIRVQAEQLAVALAREAAAS